MIESKVCALQESYDNDKKTIEMLYKVYQKQAQYIQYLERHIKSIQRELSKYSDVQKKKVLN